MAGIGSQREFCRGGCGKEEEERAKEKFAFKVSVSYPMTRIVHGSGSVTVCLACKDVIV